MNFLLVLFFAHSLYASKHDTRKRSELLSDDSDIAASGDDIVDMRDVADRVDELSYVNMVDFFVLQKINNSWFQVLVKQMDEVVLMLRKNGKSGSEDGLSGLKSTIKQLKKEKMILKRQNNQLQKRLESCGS